MTTWLEALRIDVSSNGAGADDLTSATHYKVREALTDGAPSDRVNRKLGAAVAACYGPSRHDDILTGVLGLLRCGKQGEPGVKQALIALRDVFVARVGPDRPGGADEAKDEFRKFIFSEGTAKKLADPAYDDLGGGDTTLTDQNGVPIVDQLEEVDANGQPTEAASAARSDWDNLVRVRAGQIRLEREARRQVDAEESEAADNHPTEAPALTSLLLTRSDLRDLPKPEPLIADTIDQGTTGLLYGKWGTLKSFIAIDWAASVATGRPWQGRATVKRRVLYVAAEGAFGLSARADAWEQGWHTQIADAELEILPRPVNLTNAAEVREIAAVIRWGGYSFIVFDTIARCMVGGDENSARDCGMVVDSLNRLRECTPDGRGVVMGVHHSGKDAKTLRGSSAFEGGVDTVYFASRDGAVVTLEREKRKDGPQLDHHELRLDLIGGTESGVICPHRGVGKLDRAQDLITTYRQHFPQTGASRADLRKVSDLPDTTFYRALSDLLESGELVNEGTDKRPFYKAAQK